MRYLIRCALVLACLFVARPAGAQTTEAVAHTIFLGGAAADMGSTAYFLAHKGLWIDERNPVMNWAPVAVQMPVGAAVESLAYVVGRKLLKDRHPRLFRVALIAAGVVHGSFAAYNTALIRSSQPVPALSAGIAVRK